MDGVADVALGLPDEASEFTQQGISSVRLVKGAFIRARLVALLECALSKIAGGQHRAAQRKLESASDTGRSKPH